MPFVYYLDQFSTISGVSLVIAILFKYKSYDQILKIAAVFFIISFLSDMLLLTLFFAHVRNDMPVIHVFFLLSLIFYTIIYYRVLAKPLLKKMVWIMAAVFLIIDFYDVIYVNGIWEYPSASTAELGIVLTVFSLVYFFQLLTSHEFVPIEKEPMFWINTGVLFYFSVNIFFFMLYNSFIKKHVFNAHYIHDVVNIIANLLFTIGLLCKPQKTISYQY